MTPAQKLADKRKLPRQKPKIVKFDVSNTSPESHEELKTSRYVLEPNHFVLASTAELIRVPVNMAAYVEGRSSIGRLGLQIQNAGFTNKKIQNVGFTKSKMWVLQIKN